MPYLSILIALIFIIIFIYRYETNFIIILALAGFITATGPTLEKIRPIINIFGIFLALIVFYRYYNFKYKEFIKLPSLLIKFFILLLVTLSISLIFSQNIDNSFVAFCKSLIFFFVCYLFYGVLHKMKNPFVYIYAILVSSLVLFIAILFQIGESGFQFFLIQGQIARFSGLYSNPNYVGLVLIISVPSLISFFFIERFHGAKKFYLIILFLVINLFMLIVINSRASLLAIFVSSSFILISLNKKLYLKILVSVLAVFLILYLIPSVQGIIDLWFRLDRLNTRAYFWEAGINIINDYPLFGVGADNFDKIFYSYLPSAARDFYLPTAWQGTKANPHNFFLLMMSENGILGLFMSISIFGIVSYYCYKAIQNTKSKLSKEEYIISINITGIFLGVFTRAFYEVTGIFSYGYITRDLPFWILFIVILYLTTSNASNSHLQMKSKLN